MTYLAGKRTSFGVDTDGTAFRSATAARPGPDHDVEAARLGARGGRCAFLGEGRQTCVYRTG